MNIQTSVQPKVVQTKPAVAQQEPPKEQPAPPSQDDGVQIDWNSVTRSAGFGAAYVGVPAAFSLVGTLTGHRELALVGVLGTGIAAGFIEQNPHSVVGGILLGSLGANGASLGGIAGAVAATAFGGGVFGLHDYLGQKRASA